MGLSLLESGICFKTIHQSIVFGRPVCRSCRHDSQRLAVVILAKNQKKTCACWSSPLDSLGSRSASFLIFAATTLDGGMQNATLVERMNTTIVIVSTWSLWTLNLWTLIHQIADRRAPWTPHFEFAHTSSSQYTGTKLQTTTKNTHKH